MLQHNIRCIYHSLCPTEFITRWHTVNRVTLFFVHSEFFDICLCSQNFLTYLCPFRNFDIFLCSQNCLTYLCAVRIFWHFLTSNNRKSYEFWTEYHCRPLHSLVGLNTPTTDRLSSNRPPAHSVTNINVWNPITRNLAVRFSCKRIWSTYIL
jgi:hypothetical protein